MYLQRVTQRLQFQKLLQQFALNFGVQGVNKYKQLGLLVSCVPGESEEFCKAEFGSLAHAGRNCPWLVWGSQSSHLGQRIVHWEKNSLLAENKMNFECVLPATEHGMNFILTQRSPGSVITSNPNWPHKDSTQCLPLAPNQPQTHQSLLNTL